MTNVKKFDLEERLTTFAERIIRLCKSVKNPDVVTRNIIDQLSRASTSIGSNYCEADCAESRKDFVHKLGIARKEAKETKYWLRLLAMAQSECKNECRDCWKESNEYNLILRKIILNTKANEHN